MWAYREAWVPDWASGGDSGRVNGEEGRWERCFQGNIDRPWGPAHVWGLGRRERMSQE